MQEEKEEANEDLKPGEPKAQYEHFGGEAPVISKINFWISVRDVFVSPITCFDIISQRNGPKSNKLSLSILSGIFGITFFGLILFALAQISAELEGEDIWLLLFIGACAGLVAVVQLLFISLIIFVIKAFSQKSNFQQDLLTGAICGIPFGIILLIASVIGPFEGMGLMMLYSLLGAFSLQSVLILLMFFYYLMLTLSIIQQSFFASGFKKEASWYLSPIVLALAIFFTVKLTSTIFR